MFAWDDMGVLCVANTEPVNEIETPARLGHAVHEALRVRSMRGDEAKRAFLAELLSTAVVDIVGGVEPDAAVVVMLAVVPGEEVDAVRARAFDAAEALGKVGPVLEGLEAGL
jgi:hypothetical protein